MVYLLLMYHFRFAETLFNKFFPKFFIMLHSHKLYSLYIVEMLRCQSPTSIHRLNEIKKDKQLEPQRRLQHEKPLLEMKMKETNGHTSAISSNLFMMTASACFVFPILPRMKTCSLKRFRCTQIS